MGGFAGLELEVDGARSAPVVLAPNLVADTETIGLPFRLGIALPWSVAAAPGEPRLGVFVRLLWRTEFFDPDERR